MHEQYNTNDYDTWLSYYANQALQTGFGMEGYRGTPYQRGAGLGSFFKSLFRMAVPVFKSVGKKVGRHALAAGSNVMADLAQGKPVIESVKRHSRAETSKLLTEAGNALQGGEGLGVRRKSINTPTYPGRVFSKRKTKDIFSQSTRKHVYDRRQLDSQY